MRMNAIGVVMAFDQDSVTNDPYLGPCLDGILNIYKRERQKTTLFLEQDWGAAMENIPVYGDGHCDGLLLIIPRMEHPILGELRARNPRLPFVLIGDSREGDGFVCVDLDNIRAAREATTHLLELGHRRIAAFCGNPDFCSNDQRIEGYRQALDAAGIRFDPELLFPGEYHVEWGERNARRMLERFAPNDRPTAIFALNDSIAVGAINALKEEKFSVPGDFSIIGIDDLWSVVEPLGLTTMRHPVRTVGQRAASALLGLVRGEIELGFRDLLPPELMVRKTTQRRS
jgi:LacI family transcriptional regulator